MSVVSRAGRMKEGEGGGGGGHYLPSTSVDKRRLVS